MQFPSSRMMKRKESEGGRTKDILLSKGKEEGKVGEGISYLHCCP